jgi:hypothetical protein
MEERRWEKGAKTGGLPVYLVSMGVFIDFEGREDRKNSDPLALFYL